MCSLSRIGVFFLLVISSAIPASAFLAASFGNGSGSVSSPASTRLDMTTPARQSLPDHLRLEEIPGKGFGVITNVKISAGQVVGDYKGEVMMEEEKDRRYLDSFAHLRQPVDELWRKSRIDRGQTITGTYLYGVDVPNQSSQIFVDAEDEYHSLWTRFLNHASPPAANVNPKSLHQGIDGKPRVWFVSIRDIEIGEEICFDYGDDYWLPEDNVV
uniref:SET domain-containing protein n=1 Tax=Pseudo-nitzschia australis TaxID=44445 RepID=A0A7S4EQ39_9STRA|mmetsp:Transcript_1647/g.3660  ORF Transcript_1647/g.3660 Transcript_1647/m.3660 type:complete len:214 (-) Transcript_1647:53-694(-)